MDTESYLQRGRLDRRFVAGALVALPLLLAACGNTTVTTTAPEPIVRMPVPTFTPLTVVATAPRGTGGPMLITPTPSTTPTIFVPPTPTPVVYTVKKGDTLGALAVHFGVSLQELMAVNGIEKAENIAIGQSLTIPVVAPVAVIAAAEPAATATAASTETAVSANPTHYVKVGETLSVIANLHNVQLDDLLKANGLSGDAQLTAGDALIIPRGAYTPVPTMTPVALPETPTSTPVSEPVIAAVLPTATATATPAPPTETPVPTPVVYEVQRGDVPAAIAARHGVSVDALLSANPSIAPSRLRPGDRLVIPGSSVPAATPTEAVPTPTPDNTIFVEHTITAGETITDLYVKYTTTYEKLVTYNTITDAHNLLPGAVVRIPIGTPTPTPTVIPTPTLTPTPLPAYQPPLPVLPASGSAVDSGKGSVVLSWTASGLLGSDEFYLIRLRLYDGQGNLVTTLTTWTQTTSWRLDSELKQVAGGRYTARWDTIVMRRTSAATEKEASGVALSARSSPSQFELTIR